MFAKLALAIALTFSLIEFTAVYSHAEECPTYDFSSLFYEDYYPGERWANPGESKTITWTDSATTINNEVAVRNFSAAEQKWIQDAIQSWDEVLTNISFQKVEPEANPALTIGLTLLASGIPNQANATGYWNAWLTSGNIRNRATIRIKETAPFLKTQNQFTHALQHELGNILGLGDIRPTTEIESAQEDPWQQPYGAVPLSDFDISIVRQLYGESTCKSSWAPLLSKATPTPIPVVTKAPVKKVTIVCIKKGRALKKVTAVKPKCPAGYAKKK
jgi:hypothetical protein